ncbi:Hypothetical predicted protein [Olea europaea subsp. europaea]|uniref:Uncharacterized protein n=1 Tax=Olea europaea subsp. europaea TaxID=158383 RepID=A0A8S0R5U2_OLEEU|nr:Hypothetical predicted protein [Olea europaea subsp. europaea]
MRFGLQEYTLVTGLRCGVFPEGDDFDRVLKRRRLKERYGPIEAVPEIGECFGQRVGERMTRLLICCMYTPHFVPQMLRLNSSVFSALLSYNDPLVPVLDDIAKTVVVPQFNASHAGSDRNGDDTEDSGNGACELSSDGKDTRRGQTGASSTPRVPHVSSPVRRPMMETRPIGTSGSSLTRGQVEELLLDQRILLEMRLRTVKLEIE